MYQVAYEESQRTLDDQIDELSDMRQRSVQYLAFVGTATAFLVGTSLKPTAPTRDLFFHLLAGGATALLLTTLAAVIRLLIPWGSWEYRLSGQKLIDGWIEDDAPVPNQAQLIRALTIRYDKMRHNNERILRKTRGVYVAMVALGTLQLILWVTLVWLVG